MYVKPKPIRSKVVKREPMPRPTQVGYYIQRLAELDNVEIGSISIEESDLPGCIGFLADPGSDDYYLEADCNTLGPFSEIE